MALPRLRPKAPSRKLESLADEELMLQVRGGDDAAFEVLYDRHSGVAYSLAHRMTGAPGPAAEVVQDAFLALWRWTSGYDPARGSVRNWLLGIVRNRAVDALRRTSVHQRQTTNDEGLADRVPDPGRTDIEVVRRDEARTVQAALAILPDAQRRAIELAYYGGYSHTEIADMLGAPVGTIKGRMRLGLEKLNNELATIREAT